LSYSQRVTALCFEKTNEELRGLSGIFWKPSAKEQFFLLWRDGCKERDSSRIQLLPYYTYETLSWQLSFSLTEEAHRELSPARHSCGLGRFQRDAALRSWICVFGCAHPSPFVSLEGGRHFDCWCAEGVASFTRAYRPPAWTFGWEINAVEVWISDAPGAEHVAREGESSRKKETHRSVCRRLSPCFFVWGHETRCFAGLTSHSGLRCFISPFPSSPLSRSRLTFSVWKRWNGGGGGGVRLSDRGAQSITLEFYICCKSPVCRYGVRVRFEGCGQARLGARNSFHHDFKSSLHKNPEGKRRCADIIRVYWWCDAHRKSARSN